MSSLKKPWVICVFIDNFEMTTQALEDLLGQSTSPQVLAIDNGSTLKNWTKIRKWAQDHPRLWLWRHNPSLPSLAATWNYALDFVWEVGGEEALVVNHDVRVRKLTYELLSTTLRGEDALFVSAVGVTPDQYHANVPEVLKDPSKGGPDFSCFLLSKEGHKKYRFDENFTPAYCEDLDFHRRMMLGGDGKRIFSINVPFAHFASGVLKSLESKEREALERRISEGSRAYYEKKWGGPVNHEAYWSPFGKYSSPLIGHDDEMEPTTPNLQRYYGP